VDKIPKHRLTIGRAIRKYRKQANLTQEELAEKVELHPNYVGEIERGEKAVSVEALIRIANVVKVQVAKFFVGV
jgi:transcriptional regulator with XRE-family HTH domain